MKRSPILFVLIVGGCVELEEPATSTVESPIIDCLAHPWLCSNSSGFLHYGMHELSLIGLPNGQNAIIAPGADGRPELKQMGQKYRLDVVDGQIEGLDTAGNPVLTGDAVKDAEFSLIDATTKAPLFVLHIDKHRPTTYSTGEPLHLYTITWHLPKLAPNPKQNACNGTTWPPSPNYDLFMGMNADEVLLFGSERIYVPSKTLSPNVGDTTGWITFGCAGNAIAKLDLSGNTRHRQVGADDWAGRQATLKLYVADYCGDGSAVTVPGTPLVWRGPHTNYAAAPNGGVEARWSAYGAGCLNTPRLVDHPDAAFGNPYDFIHCSLPACSADVNYLGTYPRISANYFPPP